MFLLTYCVIYKKMSFPSLVSQNPMKFRILELFNEIFNFACISLKISYFEFDHYYDITVTSYLGCWYLFWYVWNDEIPSYTMVPNICYGEFIFKSTGTLLPVNCVTKKRKEKKERKKKKWK